MSEHRDALDHIMRLCNASEMYTRRTQTIHEIAMQALGMTKNQRQERHIAIMQRVGGDLMVGKYRERCAKRAAKHAARLAEDQQRASEINARCYGSPLPSGQRYSRTTFKDNGDPILLSADGKRSVFCDLCDDLEQPA